MRVVCTFGVTIETFEPTSALTSVDLPALGAPMTATKPQREGSETISVRWRPVDAGEHGCGGRLFGFALGIALAVRDALPLMRTSTTKRGA